MKKSILHLFIALLVFLPLIGATHSHSTPLTHVHPKETNVWICDSPKVTVYHSKKDCRGLNNCKHEIKEVGKADAEKVYGRRACKICY